MCVLLQYQSLSALSKNLLLILILFKEYSAATQDIKAPNCH